MIRSLLLLFCLCTSLATAQFNLPSLVQSSSRFQWDKSGHSWGEATFRMSLDRAEVVTGAPFSGEEHQERQLTDKAPIGAGAFSWGPFKLLRDAQGRTRMERPLFNTTVTSPIKPPTIVEICDPVGGYFYILVPDNQMSFRVKFTPRPAGPPATPVVTPPSAQISVTSEPLGTKQVGGFLAVGHRYVTSIVPATGGTPLTQAREDWRLQQPNLLLVRTNVSLEATTITELRNLSLATPDPELFQPPKGWKVTDETATFTMYFGNPPPGTSR